MKRGFGTLSAALYLATVSPAFGHHSHPLFYDWCKSIAVEGRVESVEYKNPHSIIVVRQDDGTAYTVDWSARDGLTRNRILESAQGALAFGDPWLIRRVGDTFSWALPQTPDPAKCAGVFRTPARSPAQNR